MVRRSFMLMAAVAAFAFWATPAFAEDVKPGTHEGKVVKAEKGSGEPNKTKIGKITMDQCKAIAKEKGQDLNAFDLDHGARIVAGTARSMGITVEG